MAQMAPGSTEELAEKLRRYARTHDQALRNEIIAANLGLVEHLARRFTRRSESYDDLVQAGSIGLIKAVDGFKPDLGFEFAAYASKTIVGELKRHFRDRGWSIRAPRRVQELYLALGPVTDELAQRLGRSPTVKELAAEIGAAPEDVLEALDAAHAYRSASLDTPGPEGEPLASRLGVADEAFTTVEEREQLLPHLAELPERERLIIHLRFVEDLTQSEIAARIGISQMHVSRLLARSLRRLHEACRAEA